MTTVSLGNASTNPATQPSAPKTNSSKASVSTPQRILISFPNAFRILVTLVTSRVDSFVASIVSNFNNSSNMGIVISIL